MRILYITKHNPWGRGGGSTASNMYLEAFRKVFCDDTIDLCIADDIPQASIPSEIIQDSHINLISIQPRSKISKILSPITGITHRYQQKASSLLKERKYTHCVFDHSSISGTLIKKVPKGVKTIVVHHNFEPDYFADNTPNFILRQSLLPSVRHAESTSFKNSTVNIFLTKEDLQQFKDTYGETSAINIVTGLFETGKWPKENIVTTLKLSQPTIVITGSLNNVQNTDGIRYFIEELFPKIPSHYKIIIAGQKPTEEIYQLVKGCSNVELIPNPPVMNDVIRRGNIFLSPARVGGGIKVRVTDGLKAGLPVIAHKVSARGYDKYIEKGYFKVFSSPNQFELQLRNIEDEIKKDCYNTNVISNFYEENSSIDKVVSLIQSKLL